MWPEWGQGALIIEKQFKGVDPKVPQAGADQSKHQGKVETNAC